MNREPRTLDTGLKKQNSTKLTRHHLNLNPGHNAAQLNTTQLYTKSSSFILSRWPQLRPAQRRSRPANSQTKRALTTFGGRFLKPFPSPPTAVCERGVSSPSNKEHGLRRKPSRREEGKREEERERMGGGVGAGREGAVGLSPEAERRSRRRIHHSLSPVPGRRLAN